MKTVEERLQAIEDRLEIYDLIALHPISADCGDQQLTEAIYTEDCFLDLGDRGVMQGRETMVNMATNAGHSQAIKDGLSHFSSHPFVEVDGDSATAISYLALVNPDPHGSDYALPNHGTTTGFRIHRMNANKWSFVRTVDGWRIAGRRVLWMDGRESTPTMLREAGLAHFAARLDDAAS